MHTHDGITRFNFIISLGAPFQFVFEGVLLPFSHARPALSPLLRLPHRHGHRRPAEFVPLNAEARMHTRLMQAEKEEPAAPLCGLRRPFTPVAIG